MCVNNFFTLSYAFPKSIINGYVNVFLNNALTLCFPILIKVELALQLNTTVPSERRVKLRASAWLNVERNSVEWQRLNQYLASLNAGLISFFSTGQFLIQVLEVCQILAGTWIQIRTWVEVLTPFNAKLPGPRNLAKIM